MNGVTAAIILDNRYKKKDDTYSIKLRITFNGHQEYYTLKKSLTKDDWEKLHAEKIKDKDLRILKYTIAEIEKKALKICEQMEFFSFSEFERIFTGKGQKSPNKYATSSLKYLLTKKKDELIQQKKLNTANSFQCTIASFEKFQANNKRRTLQLVDVNPTLLEEYERWMLLKKNSITTVGIYLRNVRIVFNDAIAEGIISIDYYPFTKRKYQIPSGQNIKKALTIEQIKKFIAYQPKTEPAKKAKDLWLFTYLCNGINVKDIANLRYNNLSKEEIVFVRSKTAHSTKTGQKNIVVSRIPEIDKIITKWGVKQIDPSTLIFGIIDENDDAGTQLRKIKQATKNTNKYTKEIGIELGIETKITTYTARHSFATVLKRAGVSIEFISESLGHKNLKTTENYLDSFENKTRKANQKKLLDFTS